MSLRPPITFLQSLWVAVRGFREAVVDERNLRIHLWITAAVISLAAWLQISRAEWGVLILCIGNVLAVELLNTAIETVVDLVSPDHHELARKAKDISASAVLTLTIISVLLGALILLPPLVARFQAPHAPAGTLEVPESSGIRVP